MGIIIVTVRDSTNVGCKRRTRIVQRDKLGVIQQLHACKKGESVSPQCPWDEGGGCESYSDSRVFGSFRGRQFEYWPPSFIPPFRNA